MTSSSGSSSTQSTQPYIMSGPSVAAAQAAGQAQIQAAQIAAQDATQNTNSAISAMMNQYSTSLQYANPTINTGNQAAAQMNYMLGLPAVQPGAAPIAPTDPTAASELGSVTNADVNQWLQQNMGYGNINAQGNFMTDANYVIDPITGYTNTNLPGPTNGAINGPGNADGTSNGGQPSGSVGAAFAQLAGGIETPQAFLQSQGGYTGQNAQLGNDIRQTLAQQDATNAQPQYQQEMQSYNQQNQEYQQQQNLYNQYSAEGQATPSTISNIVSNLPGFQFAQQQGINSIQNSASAQGMLQSGNELEQLNQFGQGLSEQYYQNYMNNLGTLAGLGANATGSAIQTSNQLGQNIAGAYTQLGNTQANSALAEGQAAASSYLTPAANQQVIMTPYTTTSNTQTSSTPSMLSSIGQIAGLFGGL